MLHCISVTVFMGLFYKLHCISVTVFKYLTYLETFKLEPLQRRVPCVTARYSAGPIVGLRPRNWPAGMQRCLLMSENCLTMEIGKLNNKISLELSCYHINSLVCCRWPLHSLIFFGFEIISFLLHFLPPKPSPYAPPSLLPFTYMTFFHQLLLHACVCMYRRIYSTVQPAQSMLLYAYCQGCWIANRCALDLSPVHIVMSVGRLQMGFGKFLQKEIRGTKL